jgi:hypothetical protein
MKIPKDFSKYYAPIACKDRLLLMNDHRATRSFSDGWIGIWHRGELTGIRLKIYGFRKLRDFCNAQIKWLGGKP